MFDYMHHVWHVLVPLFELTVLPVPYSSHYQCQVSCCPHYVYLVFTLDFVLQVWDYHAQLCLLQWKCCEFSSLCLYFNIQALFTPLCVMLHFLDSYLSCFFFLQPLNCRRAELCNNGHRVNERLLWTIFLHVCERCSLAHLISIIPEFKASAIPWSSRTKGCSHGDGSATMSPEGQEEEKQATPTSKKTVHGIIAGSFHWFLQTSRWANWTATAAPQQSPPLCLFLFMNTVMNI